LELNDVVRRILVQHWRLILLLTIVPVWLAALWHVNDTATYTASSRLVLDTPDPETRAESTAIADMARAIATSPSQVRAAVAKAGLSPRDDVGVSVHALGSSGVLELSVTDRNPRAAAAIANALAKRLIETRRSVTEGEVNRVIADLDRRISELNRKIAQTDGKIELLDVTAATATTAPEANEARDARNELARTRDFLAQQRSLLEAQRIDLLSTAAGRPRPSVISFATPPRSTDGSGWLADLALGGLLGLVLGLGVAGLMETLRPHVVGGDSLAAALGTAHLGTLPGSPDQPRSLAEAERIGTRLRLAVDAMKLRNVDLIAARPPVELRPLAMWLEAAARMPMAPETSEGRVPVEAGGRSAAVDVEGEEAAVATAARPTTRVRAFDPRERSVSNGGATGLVVVAPTTLRNREVAETADLLKVLPVSLLGVITYSQPRSGRLADRLLRRGGDE
jgi:capsular polysaccharide biosynthesis protein